jgi:hypothetical protein
VPEAGRDSLEVGGWADGHGERLSHRILNALNHN